MTDVNLSQSSKGQTMAETDIEPASDTQAAADRPLPGARHSSATNRARRRSWWLVGGLATAALLLLGLCIGLLLWPKNADVGQDRDQVLSAAKSSVPVILSYNYQHFDGDTAAAAKLLTGRAQLDYQKAMTTSIKPAAVQTKAVVQAQTDAAGIESVSGNGKQITVIVFGEQKVTNSALSAPRTDIFRVRVILDRVGHLWLVSKFDQI